MSLLHSPSVSWFDITHYLITTQVIFKNTTEYGRNSPGFSPCISSRTLEMDGAVEPFFSPNSTNALSLISCNYRIGRYHPLSLRAILLVLRSLAVISLLLLFKNLFMYGKETVSSDHDGKVSPMDIVKHYNSLVNLDKIQYKIKLMCMTFLLSL